MRSVGIIDVIHELVGIALDPKVKSMGQGALTGVVAVVSLETVRQAPGNPIQKKQPLAHVGVHVPAVDQPLIESEDVEKGLSRKELGVPGIVEAHVRVRERDLVQVERSPELIAGADDRGWIRSGERFPDWLR